MEIWEQPDAVRIAAAQHRWLAQLRVQHPVLVSRLCGANPGDEMAPGSESAGTPHPLRAAA